MQPQGRQGAPGLADGPRYRDRLITYASGLNPPGGFQGGGGDRVAPVLRATSPRRYTTFYYCNTAAFALSLSIVLLVASQDLRRLAKIKVLEIIVALDVLALLMAYIVGSTFGLEELGVCAGLVLIVPVALIVMSSRVVGNTSGTNSESRSLIRNYHIRPLGNFHMYVRLIERTALKGTAYASRS
ncbi:hypothetical protein D1007_00223 [Hordeum vulgare]|nr:hypothetical protein D1007_00223 [Hordeum vulgare]